ncbi:hypothetical protein JCM18899A_32320 [Nocardioides sp. AN3]
MKGKLAVLAGVGVGYVLGAKAGRQRYEQIRTSATKLWQSPGVAQQRHKAVDLAKEQASAAKGAVTEVVADKMHKSSGDSGDSGDSSSASSPHSVSANDLPDAPSYPV